MDMNENNQSQNHVHTKIVPAMSGDDDKNPSEDTAESSDKKGKKRPLGNREAVRKYRKKKKARAASLEDKVVRLRDLNQQLMKRIHSQAGLEAECGDQVYCLYPEVDGKAGEDASIHDPVLNGCDFENLQCLENQNFMLNDFPACATEDGTLVANPSGRRTKRKDQFEKEETNSTGEPTIEEYMTKTQDGYRPGIARPKIDDKAHFELKGQFLKELRDNTFIGSNHEDANEHIEKVLEIVDLFHIPNIIQDQVMLRTFPMTISTEPSDGLAAIQAQLNNIGREIKKVNEKVNYVTTLSLDQIIEDANETILRKCFEDVDLFHIPNITQDQGLEVPTRQIIDSKGAIPTMIVADAKVAIQEMVEHSQKWHDGTSTRTRSTETSDGLAAIQAQLNNLGREIKKVNEKVYAAQVGCELCKGPHFTKDCPLKEDGKTLEEAYYTQFGVPFPQGGQYSAATLGFYQRNNRNPSYQERRQKMEESLSKFMVESTKRHE
ncbi:hypothetical protein Tco_0304658 [Tanacetum coccineum]